MALLFIILSTLLSAGINATEFDGANLGFSILRNDGGKKRKRHDLAEEQLQKGKDHWNEDQMKLFDFINKRMREKNEARAFINNADEAMLEHYRVFAKQIKLLPPKP